MNPLKFLSRGGSASEPTDEHFNQTTLLLHGDGTNGAQNNTFLDSSTNNFTITRNGNTTQGTFSPFSVADGEWSNYFDGSSDGLTIPASADFAFGTGDFTIEFWGYFSSIDQFDTIYIHGNTNGTVQLFFVSGKLRYNNNSVASILDTVTTIPTNQWMHFAIVRSSGTSKWYLNGVEDASVSDTTNWSNSATNLTIGRDPINGRDITGYLSNLRVVKGTAVYTSAFTPSTSPLTAVSGTELLTCQSNRFKDNSTNNFAITVNGNTSVQPFSPFAPSAAYSASVNGGSGYFDGTGDYLQAASNVDFQFGAGEFVIEGWYYFTGASANYIPLFSNGTFSAGVMVRFGTNSDLYINGTQRTWTGTTGTFPFNSWNHVCLVRTSTTVSLYVNGTRVLTATDSANISPITSFTIADQTHSLGGGFTGYVSNFRTIKGNDGPYDATLTTITVPTTLLTAVSGTELLCNFTNAGIFDNTGKNNLETVGNAQVDTTTKKYGTGSMEFDGTGDELVIPSSQNFELTGDFTIEMWIYKTKSTGAGNFDGLLYRSADWRFKFQESNDIINYDNGTDAAIINYTGSPAMLNNWHHIAFVRSGSTLTGYVDGVSYGSVTETGAFTASGSTLRVAYNGDYFGGFIDDLRITKGVARYTSAFTPPTAALPDL